MGEDSNDKKDERFQMTELFMAKADWERTYVGSLKRDSAHGKKVFRGSIIIEGNKVVGANQDEEGLYTAMDDMCVLILDHGLHESRGEMMEHFYGESGLN